MKNNKIVDIQRGQVNDDYFRALLTSVAFRPKTEKVKKGKGSYTRKNKHKIDY